MSEIINRKLFLQDVNVDYIPAMGGGWDDLLSTSLCPTMNVAVSAETKLNLRKLL